ncbi:BnaA09g14780D [Brassica napus]|uniref:BnaA09g14780D protein n=1 Tax=Brassica napus TaxID=3708 RepID=A0A078HQH6_BRANA|nr:BnaA09g14780D [Brassica napus]
MARVNIFIMLVYKFQVVNCMYIICEIISIYLFMGWEGNIEKGTSNTTTPPFVTSSMDR